MISPALLPAGEPPDFPSAARSVRLSQLIQALSQVNSACPNREILQEKDDRVRILGAAPIKALFILSILVKEVKRSRGKGGRHLPIAERSPVMEATRRPRKAGKDACVMSQWLSLLDCWS